MSEPTWAMWVSLGAVALAPLVLPMVLRGPERRRLQEGVAHLGLEARNALAPRTAVARGRVDGAEVEVRYVHRQLKRDDSDPRPPVVATVAVRVRLPRPLAVDLRLRSMSAGQQVLRGLGAQDLPLDDPALDLGLRVATPAPALARAFLADPTVGSLLHEALREEDHHVEVDRDEVRVTRAGVHAVDARPTVDYALALVRALLRAEQAPGARLAAALGLVAGPPMPDGLRRLEGTIDGVPVEVRLVPGEGDTPPRTRVRARLDPPLPGGLRLRPRAPGSPASGVSTGNPVLDATVVLHCADPEPVRRLLADDAVTAPLMELLHGQAVEGGEVHVAPASISLAHPGWDLDGAEARVRLVVEAARTLQAAARR